MTQDIYTELQAMQDFLEQNTTSFEPDGLVARLGEINTYMARSGKLLADLQFRQELDVKATFDKEYNAIVKLSATLGKKYVEACCADINHLVNWVDRINKTSKHHGDNIRTQVSFAKEQLALTRKGY